MRVFPLAALALLAAPVLVVDLRPARAGGVDLSPLDAFDTRTPEVGFDVPAEIVCRDVTTEAFRATNPGSKLVEVEAAVSLLLFHGEAARVDDVVVEIDGSGAGLVVYDYAPRTELLSELSQPVEVKESVATDKSLGASLGARLAPDVALTPTLSAGSSKQKTQTVTRSELPPKSPVVVSGTTGARTAVYFKLRRSTQSTLEGERTFRVTFAAPADWSSGAVEVRCVARGERKWLFVEQRQVWNQTARPVELRLVSHAVAKPAIDE